MPCYDCREPSDPMVRLPDPDPDEDAAVLEKYTRDLKRACVLAIIYSLAVILLVVLL